jgi:hypothetical protein
VNLRGTIALVIVAGLKVAVRVIKVKGVKFLESLTIEANGESTLLVADFVGESLAYRNVADVECILPTSAASVDTHSYITLGTVVKLANGLRGDGAVNVDLANHNPVVRDLFHEQVAEQPVLRSRRAPLRRAILAKLCAAVFAVGGCNTVRG